MGTTSRTRRSTQRAALRPRGRSARLPPARVEPAAGGSGLTGPRCRSSRRTWLRDATTRQPPGRRHRGDDEHDPGTNRGVEEVHAAEPGARSNTRRRCRPDCRGAGPVGRPRVAHIGQVSFSPPPEKARDLLANRLAPRFSRAAAFAFEQLKDPISVRADGADVSEHPLQRSVVRHPLEPVLPVDICIIGPPKRRATATSPTKTAPCAPWNRARGRTTPALDVMLVPARRSGAHDRTACPNPRRPVSSRVLRCRDRRARDIKRDAKWSPPSAFQPQESSRLPAKSAMGCRSRRRAVVS
jgi:hypothetical protein